MCVVSGNVVTAQQVGLKGTLVEGFSVQRLIKFSAVVAYNVQILSYQKYYIEVINIS